MIHRSIIIIIVIERHYRYGHCIDSVRRIFVLYCTTVDAFDLFDSFVTPSIRFGVVVAFGCRFANKIKSKQ
jgi:hypothetical protein